jgi:hypothetical protein
MALTHAQLAAAFNTTLADADLHVDAVTIGRWLKRQPTPLAPPADGEELPAWAARAQRWRRDNLKRPGPKPRAARGSELDRAELRKKKAEAALKELELASRRGELVPRKEYEAAEVLRYQAMTNAFAGMGDALARRVHLQPPDAIKVIVDDEVRRRLEIAAPPEGRGVDASAASSAAAT